MKKLKLFTIMLASLVLTAFLGLAGCGEDHGYRAEGYRDRAAPSPRYDNNQRGDLHEDRGFDSGHDRDAHGDR